MLALHHLTASPSAKPRWRSAPPPRAVPAIAAGPVRLLLTAAVDGVGLQPASIAAAPATRHLVQTLRLHQDALNVQHVSDAFVEDGSAQIELAPVLFADSPRVHIELRALRLSYTWSATRHDCHPWAAQHTLLLPHREALDAMHAIFVQKHLLGSYPYIFGPWRKALEAEKPAVTSLARSVARIVARSPNPAFAWTAAAWLDRIAKQNAEATDAARKALGRRAAADGMPDSPSQYEDIMRTALLALYTRRVRPAVINRISTAKDRAVSPLLQLDDAHADDHAHADNHAEMLDLSDHEPGDELGLLSFDDGSTMLDDDDASLLLEVEDEDFDNAQSADPGLPAEEAAEALNLLEVDDGLHLDLDLDLDLDSEGQLLRDSAFLDHTHSCTDLPIELFPDTDPGYDPTEPSPWSWHWQLGSESESSRGSSSLTAADHHGVTFPISACTVPDYDMLEFGLDVDVDVDGSSLSQSAVDIDHLAAKDGRVNWDRRRRG